MVFLLKKVCKILSKFKLFLLNATFTDVAIILNTQIILWRRLEHRTYLSTLAIQGKYGSRQNPSIQKLK